MIKFIFACVRLKFASNFIPPGKSNYQFFFVETFEPIVGNGIRLLNEMA